VSQEPLAPTPGDARLRDPRLPRSVPPPSMRLVPRQARTHHNERKRDLALFNLAIDSKLRGCDVVTVPCRVDRGGVHRTTTFFASTLFTRADLSIPDGRHAARRQLFRRLWQDPSFRLLRCPGTRARTRKGWDHQSRCKRVVRHGGQCLGMG
jgi:hypothetical protein